MRDAGGQLAKRGELLRLHQAVLRGPQILQRFRQFARARFRTFKQPRILDRDHSLVGEGGHQLDLLVGERSYVCPRQGEHADRDAFPQHRNRQHRPKAA